MRYDLAFEAEPFQGYTEFDEAESFDYEAESFDDEAGGGWEFDIKPVVRCRPIVIADFGVNSSAVKSSTKNEPLLKRWLKRFEDDPSYRLEIFGYSDCVGSEREHMFMRAKRAEAVFQLLGRKARSRVTSKGAAPLGLGLYVDVDSYTTPEGRAKNRGVEIVFTQI